MPARPPTELIVALDYPEAASALGLVAKLGDLPVIYKVGSELFLQAGPDFVRKLRDHGSRIFLDLKFHDIPHTVARAARQAAQLSAEMFTLHLAGGGKMVQAVMSELAGLPKKPKILGVSVLTSFDDAEWGSVTRAIAGRAALPRDSVERLVEQASGWGCDGVVCSPMELAQVRVRHPGLYTVVPGIRPAGAAGRVPGDDQARVLTPFQARMDGAHAIVVGRPITGAADPRAVVESILQEIS